MWTDIPLFPAQASTMASRVDNLFFFLVGLTIFFSLIIAGTIVYCAVKYHRKRPDQVGARIHGGLLLELTWTVIPLMITMVIFVWGTSVFFAMSRPPDETLRLTLAKVVQAKAAPAAPRIAATPTMLASTAPLARLRLT